MEVLEIVGQTESWLQPGGTICLDDLQEAIGAGKNSVAATGTWWMFSESRVVSCTNNGVDGEKTVNGKIC